MENYNEILVKARKVWDRLDYEDKLYVTCFIFYQICEQMDEGGTFRYLIYDRLGFKYDAYSPLYFCGGMRISNVCNDEWEKNHPEGVEKTHQQE